MLIIPKWIKNEGVREITDYTSLNPLAILNHLLRRRRTLNANTFAFSCNAFCIYDDGFL